MTAQCREWAHSGWRTVTELIKTLGWRLFLSLIIFQHLIKGFVFGGGSGGLVGIPIEYLFQSYAAHGMPNLDAQSIQILRNVALTPWALKSLIGMVTDTLHLGGYNKVPYIFTTVLASVAACLVLASCWPLVPVLATVLLFVVFLAAAVSDLLTEAMYSRAIMKTAEKGVDVVTFVWTGIFLGGILSTVIVGLLIDVVEPHWLYFLAAPCLFVTLYSTYQNWIGDTMHVNESDPTAACTVTTGEMTQQTTQAIDGPRINVAPRFHDHITNVFCRYGWYLYVADNTARGNNSNSLDAVTTEEDDAPSVTSSADGTLTVEDDDEDSISSSSSASPATDVVTDDDEWEEEACRTPLVGLNLDKIRRERNAFLLAALVSLISITTSAMAICGVGITYLFVTSLLGALLMIGGFWALTDRTTACIQIYCILQNMFSVSLSGAEFFFFLDDAAQYPEGPHFSRQFYVIVCGTVTSVCLIVGSLSYATLMKSWHYRSVFCFNTCFSFVAGLFNIVVYKRWNVALGISDRVFVLGAETVQVIIGQWNSMPMTTMMSQLCPRDMEATMFALLAGSRNLGASLAVYQGTYLLKLLNINPSGAPGESAQFENLWLASLIGSALSLVTVVCIPFLIPDRYQTEKLLDDDAAIEAARQRLAEEMERKAQFIEEDYDTEGLESYSVESVDLSVSSTSTEEEDGEATRGAGETAFTIANRILMTSRGGGGGGVEKHQPRDTLYVL
jgi:hypothetical protein